MLPVLSGWKEVSDAERRMLSLPVREGGMAIDNPTLTADANYKASLEATQVIQVLIMEGGDMTSTDFAAHNMQFGDASSDAKAKRHTEQARWRIASRPHRRMGLPQTQTLFLQIDWEGEQTTSKVSSSRGWRKRRGRRSSVLASTAQAPLCW